MSDAPSDEGAEPLVDAESLGGGIRLELPTFEGPLDLLLHLIQKHELNILDIPIGFITEKYLEYIELLRDLSIDIASDYLVMAATLAHIKSKMLLPTPPEDQDEGEIEEDPRTELVRRLLEYQKYKLAAEQLGSRTVFGRDVFGRGSTEAKVEGPAPLAPVSMFQLLDAFETVLVRVRRTEDHEVDFERISISDRINQLSDILRARKRLLFEDLFAADRTRADVIVTFLALLEMTRLRMTRVWQEAPYAAIQIELSVIEDEETLTEGASAVETPVGQSAPSAAPANAPAEPVPAPGDPGPSGVDPGS